MRIIRLRRAAVTLALAVAAFSPAIAGATQGVSKDEIVVGTIQDLSGPLTMLGTHFRNGSQMRFDEINEQGGIHGRKIRFVVEDSGYDPKKALLATQKMLQKDQVFAMMNNLGSAVVMATMQSILDKHVLHLFPAAPIPPTYEPLHKLKFGLHTPYSLTTPIGAKWLIQQHGFKKVGILYQDDDYGYDVLKGLESALHDLGMPLCDKASYKRGATDFSSQISKLRASNCDFVVLGTVVRETLGAVGTARKMGWNVPMMVSPAGYTSQIHKLGGAAMEGLYGVSLTPEPYAEGAGKQLTAWIDSYKKRFNTEPTTWAVMAYASADLFVMAAQKAGPKLTAEGFASAMEQVSRTRDFFGSPNYTFSASDHLGNRSARVAQIRGGKWENLTDYMK